MLNVEELRRAAEASDDPIASNRLLQAVCWIEHLQARLALETAALEASCAAPLDKPLTVEQARAAHEPCPDDIRALFNRGLGAQVGSRFSFSFPTEEDANRAFHYIAQLGELETSQPPKGASNG